MQRLPRAIDYRRQDWDGLVPVSRRVLPARRFSTIDKPSPIAPLLNLAFESPLSRWSILPHPSPHQGHPAPWTPPSALNTCKWPSGPKNAAEAAFTKLAEETAMTAMLREKAQTLSTRFLKSRTHGNVINIAVDVGTVAELNRIFGNKAPDLWVVVPGAVVVHAGAVILASSILPLV